MKLIMTSLLLGAAFWGSQAHAQTAGTRVYVRAGDQAYGHIDRTVSQGNPDYQAPSDGPARSSGSVSFIDLASSRPIDASATAYADLTTGKLGITTRDATYASESQADAFFQDYLTFDIAGADSNSVTPIHVLWSLHGAFDYVSQYGVGTAIGQVFLYDGYGAHTIQSTQGTDAATAVPSLSSGGFSASVFTRETDGYRFDGTYLLYGAHPQASLFARLSIGTDAFITANFGNTGTLSFALPENVSFTSASGTFLTASAVPEPAGWALMIAGFGLVGGTMRRRSPANEKVVCKTVGITSM